MSKPVKFVYVSLDKNYEFQKQKRENNNIVPCSLYVDNKEHKIYFVEEQTGEILDVNFFEMPNISDKVLGL